MYVLLFKHTEGELEGRRDFIELQTEKELLAFLLDNTIREENIEILKILSGAVECEVNYALSLKPAKRSAADKKKREEEKITPIPEKPDPGMIDRQDKETPDLAERKCSVCGAAIKAWSKTGKCTPCQQGKKTKSKK